MTKWWVALPHHSHRSCACPRIAAEQEQVELCSQVLNVLCYCLIDFKLCLLGNTPLRTCYIRLEMFFPNAALCLVNPLCAAGSFKGLCLKLELQQCLTPLTPASNVPTAHTGMVLWRTLSSAVNHHHVQWWSPKCSAAVLPLKDWLGKGSEVCIMCTLVTSQCLFRNISTFGAGAWLIFIYMFFKCQVL